MAYTSLLNVSGLDSPTQYGSGVEWAGGLMSLFPEADLQLGLYLAGARIPRVVVVGVVLKHRRSLSYTF